MLDLDAITRAWARDAGEVLKQLNPSPSKGLTTPQARDRLDFFGANRLDNGAQRGPWAILFSQLRSLIVLLLAIAAGISFAFQDYMECGAIVAVIALNTVIGFVTELRATRSMQSLRNLTQVQVTVRRDGRRQSVPAEDLVPGDILLIDGGDVIGADARLMTASRLQVDESSLTGESAPVEKQDGILAENTELMDRSNMIFSGTAVTRGTAEGVVVATGMETELGRISRLVEEAKEEITPLEKRLAFLGRRLIWITLAVAAATAVIGIRAGRETYLMIETSIALAVAAIPEGLPIVATIALARGMWRMARRNALINRLSAVETLGAATVICTDKTGTLTENRMTVIRLVLDGESLVLSADSGAFLRNGEEVAVASDQLLLAALETSVLCNNASLPRPGAATDHGLGDPLEIALLEAAARGGLKKETCLRNQPRTREEAFDPELKMMATIHREDLGAGCVVAVKGAAECVIKASSHSLTRGGIVPLDDNLRRTWLDRNEELAGEGLRVLALACKEVRGKDDEAIAPYEDLIFIGLAGLLDPARSDVADAIRQCRKSGIRVVMVTGDQPGTAMHVARDIGLVEGEAAENILLGKEIHDPDSLTDEEADRIRRADILARVTPKQKLDLIELHQRGGAVVAMTGDGVNDAPALKEADIGIAMGRRGTEVAREAADMILKDDSFSTIVAAVREGRVIFANIRKFVFYLLSCNLSEILIVGIASGANAPLPVLPLQILFLNLVTDVFPALALGVGEGSQKVMESPAHSSRRGILEPRHWVALALYAILIAAAVLSALFLAINWLQLPTEQAVSASFLVLALSQLWHVFNMRDHSEPFLRNQITRNRYVWAALALCLLLLAAAVYVPGLAAVLKVHDPGAQGWILVAVLSLTPLIIGQAGKEIVRRIRREPTIGIESGSAK